MGMRNLTNFVKVNMFMTFRESLLTQKLPNKTYNMKSFKSAKRLKKYIMNAHTKKNIM